MKKNLKYGLGIKETGQCIQHKCHAGPGIEKGKYDRKWDK